jgi:hypothetical protein
MVKDKIEAVFFPRGKVWIFALQFTNSHPTAQPGIFALQ